MNRLSSDMETVDQVNRGNVGNRPSPNVLTQKSDRSTGCAFFSALLHTGMFCYNLSLGSYSDRFTSFPHRGGFHLIGVSNAGMALHIEFSGAQAHR